MFGCLNSLRWDKNIAEANKKRVGEATVESALCYASEVCVMNADTSQRVNTTKMDYGSIELEYLDFNTSSTKK